VKRGKRPGRGELPLPAEPVRTQLDEALRPFGSRPPRTQSLPILQVAQAVAGWLSPEVIAYIHRITRIPVAHLTGLTAFYDLLSAEPQGQYVIRVCDDVACRLGGRAEGLLHQFEERLSLHPGETTPDGRITLKTTACLGGCDRGPCLLVNRAFAGPVDGPVAAAIAANPHVLPPVRPPERGWLPGYAPRLLHRCGQYDPAAAPPDRMGGLRLALQMGPEPVIAGVTASKLVGRGGAAFPTGVKWDACRKAPGGTKYVVLNADESEPGTFTNRLLLEEDPWLVLEGMIIAAFAAGATKGYAYIRGEYALALERFVGALAGARRAGFLGDNILGSGFAFDIEVRSGAGAYVCGEETALFASIEGYRGEPRVKPPFPTVHGLFGRPTVINNVETLACVPAILLDGADRIAQAPPKLFAISGHVRRPGVYEAPLGTPLRQVLEQCAGGVVGEVQAVLVGGAAGMFLRPDRLETPLDYQAMRQAGAALGSGAIFVLNQTVDLWEVARRLARFFAAESCGKCTPCRLGTERQSELVSQICRGTADPSYMPLLEDLALTMSDASICGLGQGASWAVQSLIKQWGMPGGKAGG
jgi:NADH-quinone oxidoreductase subunit F